VQVFQKKINNEKSFIGPAVFDYYPG